MIRTQIIRLFCGNVIKEPDSFEAVISDAVSKGARVLVGGKRHSLGGTFFEPTVPADITSKMKVAWEETFGPVAPLFRFHQEEDAVQLSSRLTRQ